MTLLVLVLFAATASLEEAHAHGYEIEVDKEPEHIWKTIATSDVAILSRTDFSFLPAMISAGEVVYTPYWTEPLDTWTVVDSSLTTESEQETIQLQFSCPKL